MGVLVLVIGIIGAAICFSLSDIVQQIAELRKSIERSH